MSVPCAVQLCPSMPHDFCISNHVLFSYSDILDLNQNLTSSLRSNVYSTVHHVPLQLRAGISLDIVNYVSPESSCVGLTLLRLNCCGDSTSPADICITMASICRWMGEMHVSQVSVMSSCALAQAQDDIVYTSSSLSCLPPRVIEEFTDIQMLSAQWPLDDLVLGQLLHFCSYLDVETQVFLLRGYQGQRRQQRTSTSSSTTYCIWKRLMERYVIFKNIHIFKKCIFQNIHIHVAICLIFTSNRQNPPQAQPPRVPIKHTILKVRRVLARSIRYCTIECLGFSVTLARIYVYIDNRSSYKYT